MLGSPSRLDGAYDFTLAGTAAKTYAVTADASGGALIKANTTSKVTLALTPPEPSPLGGLEVRFVQALAAFSTGAIAHGGYVTSVTSSVNLTAAHVGSAAAGSAWGGR